MLLLLLLDVFEEEVVESIDPEGRGGEGRTDAERLVGESIRGGRGGGGGGSIR